MIDVGVEQLIGEVKRRPVLWDPTHSDFNNRHSKLSAWVEVATNLYVDSEDWSNYDKFGKVRELQKRWKNFRDSYMREVKYSKKVEKGLALPKKKKYVYTHLLTFLSPGNQEKSQSPSEQSSSEEESNVDMDMDQDNTVQQTNQSTSRVEPSACRSEQNNTIGGKNDSSKQDNQETSYLEEYLKQQQYTYQKVSEQNLSTRFHPTGEQYSGYSAPGDHPGYSAHPEHAELDDDKMFLLSLLPFFKKLEDSRKLQARMSVTKVVHDFLYKTS